MNLFFNYALVVGFTLLCVIIGCGETQDPLQPLEVNNKHFRTIAETKTPPLTGIPAAPQAPTTPTDGTPFVKEVGYYSNWRLTKPLTPADTVAPGKTIYTKVVFSQPILYAQIAGERTRYRITPHGARGAAFTTGDAKPKGNTTDTFICKYTVQSEDTGLFTLAVGKRSADTAGNPLAAFYVHSSKRRLGQSAERQAEAIHLSNNSIDENSAPNTVVGVFETPVGTDLTYNLLRGPKILFEINENNALVAKRSFNYERDATAYLLTIRERNKATGQRLTKEITILVNDVNEAPIDLEISTLTFPEGVVIGTQVAGISVTDEDATDVHTFELIEGEAYLEVEGNSLRARADFPPDLERISILVEVTDQGGEMYREAFTLARVSRAEPSEDDTNTSGDDTDTQEPTPPSEPKPSQDDDLPSEPKCPGIYPGFDPGSLGEVG